MSFKPLTYAVLTATAALFAISPVAAQAPVMPDCTGISDVSDFDGANISDFAGFLTTVRVATGLVRPTHVASPPDGPSGPDDRLFIVEQRGTIRILDIPTGVVLGTFFMDIQTRVQSSGDEEGLLSIAFHPKYNTPGDPNEGHFFVYYTNTSGNQQISRFSVGADPNDADETSEAPVITISHPTFTNHNGGQLAFGPDGYLYAGTGDGGGGCDPFGTGQNLLDLRGKQLRLQVDTLPYSTTDNPWDGNPSGLDEIWAYGLRNPWRFSFDRSTGHLLIGDVGQNQIEEIDCQLASSVGGDNYGWEFYEGSSCPNPSCGGNVNDCAFQQTKPILEYSHSRDGFSCSITGGFVYRGCRMSDLHGSYMYADYCSDNIRTFRVSDCFVATTEINRTADLVPEGGGTITDITSFGEDSRGELYIADRFSEVYKVLPVLSIMEVSGANASPLQIGPASFQWEDIQSTSGHPITSYKIYRAIDDPVGTFSCVHQSPDSEWVGGDPDDPAAGETFYYLVTALNAQGDETLPGYDSVGNQRVVDTASACP
jgi:glucose/arabinose dehydrogenase